MAPQPHHAPAPLVDVERALLGALMVNDRPARLVAEFLKPRHFVDQRHQTIWVCIWSLIRRNIVATPIAVIETAGDCLDDIGGKSYVVELLSVAAKYEDILRLAHDLRDHWYQNYLRSDEWRAKRRLVMDRCGGLCEGCRNAPVSEVHHLTYEHVGDELLFELVGLCRECHQRVHS
jgi:DnaB-like helicase N terminal domain